jgi:glycyl-tRNA synthetase beta chain
MIREFPELQGVMGGVYARVGGETEDVWKAIYYHYLPIGVEADAPPTKAQLGPAAVPWAVVSLADKLDTIVGLFGAGEKPTGSRDPFGLRRAAQGVVKILTDLPALGINPEQADLWSLLEAASQGYPAFFSATNTTQSLSAILAFMWERAEHLLERRGFKRDEIRVVGADRQAHSYLPDTLRRVEAVAKARSSADFEALAVVFKRVKNITKGIDSNGRDLNELRSVLIEPAEITLLDELQRFGQRLQDAHGARDYARAMLELAKLRAPVDRFFADVLVMAEDKSLRDARLAVLTRLRDHVLRQIGDIAEIAPEEKQA